MDKTLLSYVRDFSVQARQYLTQKSEESLALLNRTATLLSTALQTQHLEPQQVEVAQFFIDVHAVMSALANDAYALWSCVALLQQCSRHAATRQALVEQYRYVPMLTFVLERTPASDKVQPLLTLLQELTFGIRIGSEEPFVLALLKKLMQIIDEAVCENCNELQAQLALSVLINLCYRNFEVVFLFLRNVSISSFSCSIKSFGMQASKLLLILSEDINVPDARELQLFLCSLFAAIGDSLKQWNVAQLRHNVEFLLDARIQCSLHAALLDYTHFGEDIERLLTQLETTLDVEHATEEQQLCLGLIFKLLRFICQLNDEHNKSIDIKITRIYELLSRWVASPVCGVDAVQLLQSLILFANKKNSIVPRLSSDDLLEDLIVITEKAETTPSHITAILQVLLQLLNQNKTDKLILSRITESYYDKMFTPL